MLRVFLLKVEGGLGNQMFQYATARALMKNFDFLLFNVSSYKDDYLDRKFKLLNYNIMGSVSKNKFFEKAFIPNTTINIILDKLSLYSLIKGNGFLIHNELLQKTKLFTRIQGFWQSELYFNSIRSELISEFMPKVIPTLPKIFLFPNTVGIHVRRTDYLNDLRYGFIGENYYRNAMSLVKQKVLNPCFILFSDDIQWCKRTFREESIVFSDVFDWLEDYDQLYLMSKCKHQIIANSSFSWWGAWLNTNPHKIVVRPIKPFNDPSLLYENHYPSNWIAI